MKITVTRNRFTDISTIGDMEIDGEFECVVLEDKDRRLEDGGEKIKGSTAISRGIYKVTIDKSVRFGKFMPHIIDVPGFEGIRIHSGNSAADTSGCLLTGMDIAGPDAVSRSRMAYEAFFKKLQVAIDEDEEVTIEIK